MLFIKYAAFHLQQLGLKKQREKESRNSQDRELTQNGEKESKVWSWKCKVSPNISNIVFLNMDNKKNIKTENKMKENIQQIWEKYMHSTSVSMKFLLITIINT